MCINKIIECCKAKMENETHFQIEYMCEIINMTKRVNIDV